MFPQMWKNENYKVMKGRKLGKIDIETPINTVNPFFKNYKFFFNSLGKILATAVNTYHTRAQLKDNSSNPFLPASPRRRPSLRSQG
jgi:hypothetical protein